MNSEFFEALEALEKEKGIPVEYMYERVEAALVSAYKRELNCANGNIRVHIDPVKKNVKVYQQKTVVETVEDDTCQISLADAKKIAKKYNLDSIVEFEINTKNFRRTAAQTAKQVIIQSIREAERGMMIKEYENKKEEVISAVVQRVDPVTGNIVVDTGTSMATLIKSEQIPGETFEVGEHIKVFVMEVSKESLKGPLVTLSRVHPHMVKRLFELDVPEIQDGTVIIKSLAREAGTRTKMAVMSRDESVDPVGACIGNRGMRINAIVDELKGEKIDIVHFSEDPEQFIAEALAPATVKQVIMDGERSCKAIVDNDQLSLAIGKEGQNARLAVKLTGYKIDIKTSV